MGIRTLPHEEYNCHVPGSQIGPIYKGQTKKGGDTDPHPDDGRYLPLIRGITDRRPPTDIGV